MTFNCTQYELVTQLPTQVIQESQSFKEQTEKSIQQKRWRLLTLLGSVKWRRVGFYLWPPLSNELPHLLFSSPVHERGWFPGSPCHVIKKDPWCGRVPQTWWHKYALNPLPSKPFLIFDWYTAPFESRMKSHSLDLQFKTVLKPPFYLSINLLDIQKVS